MDILDSTTLNVPVAVATDQDDEFLQDVLGHGGEKQGARINPTLVRQMRLDAEAAAKVPLLH